MRLLVNILLLALFLVPLGASADAANPPVSLRVLYGGNQNTSARLELARPITFKVTSKSGLGVANVNVQVTIQGDAKLLSTPSSLTTDAYGYVSVRIEGGSLPGTYSVQATFDGLVQPTVTQLTVVPFLRLNAQHTTKRSYGPDLVTSGGSGVFLSPTSTDVLGRSQWRLSTLSEGAYASEELPAFDRYETTSGGFSAIAPDGSSHFIYPVIDLGITKLRYVKVSKGEVSVPLDLKLGSNLVLEGDFIADANGADLVYTAFGYQVRHAHMTTTANSDVAISVPGQLAAWPSIAQGDKEVVISYTSFDAAGSYVHVVNGTNSAKLSGTDLGASQLSSNGQQVVVVWSDGSKQVFLSKVGDLDKSIPTGLDTGSPAAPGRAFWFDEKLYVVATSGQSLSLVAITDDVNITPSPHVVSNLANFEGLQGMYTARAVDASGKLTVLLSASNGSDGSVNTYLTAIDIGACASLAEVDVTKHETPSKIKKHAAGDNAQVAPQCGLQLQSKR